MLHGIELLYVSRTLLTRLLSMLYIQDEATWDFEDMLLIREILQHGVPLSELRQQLLNAEPRKLWYKSFLGEVQGEGLQQ